jgi:hypothetical protein
MIVSESGSYLFGLFLLKTPSGGERLLFGTVEICFSELSYGVPIETLDDCDDCERGDDTSPLRRSIQL